MNKIKTVDVAISRLEALFQVCNERDDDLIQYIEQLVIENDQLKRSIQRLRASKGKNAAASSMHSKLSEALRE